MGCLLHDLLFSVEKERILFNADCDDNLVSYVVRVLNKYGKSAICFDMGAVEGIPEGKPCFDLVKEPYPVSWFETRWLHEDGCFVVLGLLVVRDEGLSTIIACRKKRSQWMVRGVSQGKSLSCDHGWGVAPVIDHTRQEMRALRCMLSVFLTMLHCKNVIKVENLPHAKMQRARLRKGKLPLFSYWTLELKEQRGSDRCNLFGSPDKQSRRLHLCRGHFRRYTEEKPLLGKHVGVFWVPAHVKGKKEMGMVHKDYRFNG